MARRRNPHYSETSPLRMSACVERKKTQGGGCWSDTQVAMKKKKMHTPPVSPSLIFHPLSLIILCACLYTLFYRALCHWKPMLIWHIIIGWCLIENQCWCGISLLDDVDILFSRLIRRNMNYVHIGLIRRNVYIYSYSAPRMSYICTTCIFAVWMHRWSTTQSSTNSITWLPYF